MVIMKSLTPGIGDIATFTAPLTPAGDHRIPVSHRIIGQDERGFITKGDATPQDWWRVPSSDLTGQVVASFPRVWIFRVAAILIGLAVLLMLWPKDEGPQPGTVAWWRRRLGGEEPWLREQPFGLREVESR